MDEVEQKFLETQSKKAIIWLRYINDIFIWTHEQEQELERFLRDLNNFTRNLCFTHEASKDLIPFIGVKVKLIHDKLSHPEQTKCLIVYSRNFTSQ